MPADSYTFRVTIAGADAIQEAKKVRTAIAKEFGTITIADVGKLDVAIAKMEKLRLVSRGVGTALTRGFGAQVDKLITQIGSLQQEVNMVVRAGINPVQEALDGMGIAGLEALDMVDTGAKETTQAMAKMTQKIQGAQIEIKQLQERQAKLGDFPIVPQGAPGQVMKLSQLWHDMTHQRIKDVRKLARESAAELKPMADAIKAQAEVAKAEAAPAIASLREEIQELTAAQKAMLAEKEGLGKWQARYRELIPEIELYKQAIVEASTELSKWQSIAMGTGASEEQAKLNYLEAQHLGQLQEKTVFWKELVQGGGDYARIIDHIAKTSGKKAADRLAEMVQNEQRMKKLSETRSRTIGRMEKLKDVIELPPGTEGSLAMLVVAERSLGESTKTAADHVKYQKTQLLGLARALDTASQAAEGLDRTQREAMKRVQMAAEREMRAATPRGTTTTMAGAAVVPILATMNVQMEAIKRGTLAKLEEIEAEGAQKRPFGWLIRMAEEARRRLVGGSIIPEMVTSINTWLAKIGIEDPFSELAMEAQIAGERIQTGLQERLRTLSTDQAQQELKDLQEELRETAHVIESQLASTSQASQEYKQAFKSYADEVRRVRGDDPQAMALIAQGKVLAGTGMRGEFKTLDVIDEGYQAIRTTVEERQRFSEEENAKLLALETKYTAMRQAAMALERELAERRVAGLEKSMAAALDEGGDVEAFEQLNREYTVAQERLGDISEEIAYERKVITSKAVAAAKAELTKAKQQARRTIPAGAVGTAVGGEVVMPRITKTQVANVEKLTVAYRGLGAELGGIKADLPLVTEEESKRLVETTRSVAQAEEAERRLTATKRTEGRIREIDAEMVGQATLEVTRQVGKAAQEEEKRRTLTHRAELKERERADTAAARIEVEKLKQAGKERSEQERRITLDHKEELRERAKAEREARRAQQQPTPADIQRYGGGRLGALSYAVQEAQMQQMGLRMLTYDLQRVGRTMQMAGAAMAGPPILAMKRFAEYTRETNRAGSAMGLAKKESDALRHELILQSQALGMVSPEEMASGLYTWVTGVGAAATNMEELRDVIESTIPIQQMSYMQQISLGEATESTAGILAEYKMETSETQRVVEILNATADRTFAAVSDLGQAFKFIGPVADQLGISFEQTAATMGLLSDANIRGSMAGRAMRQLMIRLVKSTEAEDDALNKVLKRNTQLGQSWRDLAFPNGEFIGLAKWIDLLAAATENMTQEQRGALLATISTANELPALTALVSRQIDARERGINIIRAEEKLLTGALDAEVEAYAAWSEEISGNIMSVENAADGFARKVEENTDSEVHQLDRLKIQWDATMLALGEETMKMALPALKELTDVVEDLAQFVTDNPWIATALVSAGGVLVAVGSVATTAAIILRSVNILRTVTSMMKGWTAAKQILAADTQMIAANTQLAAAQTQAASNTKLVGGLAPIAAILAGAAAVVGGLYIGEKVAQQIEPGVSLEMYIKQSLAMIAGSIGAMGAAQGGPFTSLGARDVAPGEVAQAFEQAFYDASIFLGLLEESTTEIEGWEYELQDATDEMASLKEMERAARNEAQGLGSDLMQVAEAAGGLAVFSEAELEAIDELEAYLRKRNDMIREHNDALADMEQDFLQKEAEHYADYLDQREKLEKEMRELAEEPLWRMSDEVKKSEKRIAKAIEDYNKRIANAIEQHQRKLRDLRESHDDKMEDLEAKRDAKGIIAERRQYRRSVRNANEHLQDTIDAQKERIEETIANEREKIATMREERIADLQEKLDELDANYAEEVQKRQEAHERELADKREQQAKALQQLEQAHAERLAKIMGWEERVRDALRNSYIGREADLSAHLAAMERQYLEYNNMLSQLSTAAMTPEEYREYHEQLRGHQMGGYASSGVYRLGEAGKEFVLSAPTTAILERAIGPLNQARITQMAGGHATRVDVSGNIHVTADPRFSPEFVQALEAGVRQQIIDLSTQAAQSRPGAYRPHS